MNRSIHDRYVGLMETILTRMNSLGRREDELTLLGVTKYAPITSILEAYQAGCRHFGESRVQEAQEKLSALPQDCHWHMIGSLQSNKVRKALAMFDMIHTVDSLDLAQKISTTAQECGKNAEVLLQVNVSGETSKHGLLPQTWFEVLPQINALPNFSVRGLMTMAPLTDDTKVIRTCFSRLHLLRDEWKKCMSSPDRFIHLSMGMSNDYLIAIEEGTTLLRIGTALFG